MPDPTATASLVLSLLTIVQPHRISSVTTGDWDGDGRRDRALLVEREGTVDLHIYVDIEAKHPHRIIAPDIAWRGGMWGQSPSSAIGADGSLLLRSENESVGRHRWSRVLTIRWRADRMEVTAFSHVARDTLDPDDIIVCELDLVTGRGSRNGRRFRTRRGPVSVEQWNVDVKLCAP